MEKTCTKCHITKDMSEFHLEKNQKDGHRTRCKSCIRVYSKSIRIKKRAYRLLTDFGMTLTEYHDLYNTQDKRCAICNTRASELPIRLAVDHNHKTGVVRGLLCDRCNRGMGFFQDNVTLLFKAIHYLNKKQPKLIRTKHPKLTG